MYAKIQPVNCVPSTATILTCNSVSIRNLYSNYQVQLSWSLLSDKSEVLQSQSLLMSKEDYDKWGSDDTYLLNYLADKLKLSIIEIVNGNIVTYDPPVLNSVLPSL